MDWRKFDKSKRKDCLRCPRLSSVFVPPVVRDGSKLAVLAEAPGETEKEAAEDGRKECVLVGRSGVLENRILAEAGIERSKISLVNTVMCWVASNPKPTVEEVECCSGLVERALRGVEVVIALGATATNRLIGVKPKTGKNYEVKKWRGSVFESRDRVYIGTKTVLDPKITYKSGAKKGQPKPQKQEVVVNQHRRQVVVSLHPAELLRTGRKAEGLVVADHVRAKRIVSGAGLVQVGGEIHSKASGEELANALSQTKKACVDLETKGLSGKVLCVGVAVDKDSAFVVNPTDQVKEILRMFFASKSNTFIAHNAAFDLRVMQNRMKVNVDSMIWDTMHAAAYERPDIRARNTGGWDEYLALETVASRMPWLRYFNWKEDFRSGSNPDLRFYCGMDAATEFWIAEKQRYILERTNRLERFESVLMKLFRMLMRMEDQGVRVDKERLNFLQKQQEELLKEASLIWKTKFGDLNWESSKSLMKLFYKDMGLKVVYTRKRPGVPSRPTLDKSAIERIARENPNVAEIKLVSKLRHLKKKLSKDLNLELTSDNRAHFEYNLSGTFTGRLSSNAQQFPRGIGKCKDGFEGCVCGEIRSIVLPDRKNESIIVADFDQIEARITAWLSQETWLIEAFERKDFDYHKHTGQILSNRIPWIRSMSEKDQREYGKKGNHAMNYGMGIPGIMDNFKCSPEDAAVILETIRKSRPKLGKWWDSLLKEVENNGEIVTPYGRRMRFRPDDRGRFELPKIAASMVQSTAWEVIADSMVEAEQRGLKVRIQAHDELVISGGQAEAQELIEIMQAPRKELGGRVCPVSVGIGKNWEEAKKRS
jgi:uracil-DNA glycosylase family 4